MVIQLGTPFLNSTDAPPTTLPPTASTEPTGTSTPATVPATTGG